MANDEYYTALKYLKLVYLTLSSIDLDPSSCVFANQFVGAKQYFDLASNGLKQEWKANNIFLNYPYSDSTLWMNKLYSEYKKENFTSAIILSNATTDLTWFHKLQDLSDDYPLFEELQTKESRSYFAVCFVKGRISFIDKQGLEQGSPRNPSMFICLSRNKNIIKKFEINFREIGMILKP